MIFSNHPHLFNDPGLTVTIPDSLNFTDYIERCKQHIRQTRPDATAEVIAANEPYELHPTEYGKIKRGVLLIHGLLGSPYSMKDLALHFHRKGFLVRAVLLPGHGTVPGNLLHVRYQDWVNTVNYGVSTFTNDVDEIFLVGFSTGGALALHHVLQENARIARVILLAPALKIHSKIDFAANWHRLISWAWPRAAWYYVTEEIDYACYQSIAFNAAYQVYCLVRDLHKRTKIQTATCPLFWGLSQDDKTVSSDVSLRYFLQQKNPENRLVLFTNKPPAFQDPRITYRLSAHPDQHIINLSHIGTPIAPSNPRYGRQGNCVYASCVEQHPNTDYQSLNRAEVAIAKKLFHSNVLKILHENLTFNPDFDFLISEINQFIQ